jgi:hypothetical protein
MKQFNVTVQAEIKVEFDENSDDFKELWRQYLRYFDKDATYETFTENIASIISRYGTYEFIEGVGYVNLNGSPQKFYSEGEYKEHLGIVNVEVDTDLNSMVAFEIDYIEEL